MKITVDKEEVFELLDWEKSLIKNDIPSEDFESDMMRRVVYCICSPIQKKVHSCHQDFCRSLKDAGVKEVPGDLDELTEFIGSRKDLGLEQSHKHNGCSLECDNVPFHKVTCAQLCLVKSFFEKDEVRFLNNQIGHFFREKIKCCLVRMHTMWDPKLSERNLYVPLDDEAFVNLVISQDDYQDRAGIDKEVTEIDEVTEKKL